MKKINTIPWWGWLTCFLVIALGITAYWQNWYRIGTSLGSMWGNHPQKMYARTNPGANAISIVTDKAGKQLTYIGSNATVEVKDFTLTKAHISFDGVDGYIPRSHISSYTNNVSDFAPYFIKKDDGYLYRVFWDWEPSVNNYYESNMGKAPSYLPTNQKMYSNDSFSVDGHPLYNYFQIVNLHSDSRYTAADFNAYLKAFGPKDANGNPTSSLIGHEQEFIDAGNANHINPLYLLAHAIVESNWGNDSLSLTKNNLFGISAYDIDPYNNAHAFTSYKDCINYMAGTYLGSQYIFSTPTAGNPNSYHGGAILGNKGRGLNVQYASDPYWGNSIASRMSSIDDFLGNKDRNVYSSFLAPAGTTLYSYNPVSGSIKPVTTIKTDRFITAVRTVSTPNGNMIETFSDERGYDKLYIKPDIMQPLPTY